MPGPGFGDLQSGMAMAGAICAGLYHQSQADRGVVVDVSLMGMGLWMARDAWKGFSTGLTN